MNRQYGALSGLAMVLIVLNHAITIGIDTPARLDYPPVAGWGYYLLTILQALGTFAVPIFLFISGSFVSYAARGTENLSLKFIWSSLRHILLPYLLWSLVFYLVVFLHYQERYSLLGYAKNLAVGYPFHFVPLLALYYVLAPVLVRLGKHYGWLVLLAIGLYQLFLINVRDPGILGFTFPGWARYLTPPVLFNTMADWGIYFPLGMIFSLHNASLKPRLQRLRWLFVGLTAVLFVLGILDRFEVVAAPWARFFAPLPLLCLAPIIDRNSIPLVRHFEQIGKRAYGIYLTHLIILDLFIWVVELGLPGFFRIPVLVFPLLFAVGLGVPLLLMNGMSQGAPTRKIYRYVFG